MLKKIIEYLTQQKEKTMQKDNNFIDQIIKRNYFLAIMQDLNQAEINLLTAFGVEILPYLDIEKLSKDKIEESDYKIIKRKIDQINSLILQNNIAVANGTKQAIN